MSDDWRSQPCICGCGRRSANRHHVLYRQTRGVDRKALNDPRNLVPIAFDCHMRHHNRTGVLELGVLPDGVFEFATEVMGAGAAYEYLRRRYEGTDPRLDALIEEKAA